MKPQFQNCALFSLSLLPTDCPERQFFLRIGYYSVLYYFSVECIPCGIYACILLPWINMAQCTLDSFLRLRLIFGTHHCSLPPLPLPFHTRSERGEGIKQDKSTSCPSYLTQPPFSPPPPDRLSPTNRPTTIRIPPSHSLVYSPRRRRHQMNGRLFRSPLSSSFLLLKRTHLEK